MLTPRFKSERHKLTKKFIIEYPFSRARSTLLVHENSFNGKMQEYDNSVSYMNYGRWLFI